MIVRAAVADALVHVRRGDGELPAGSAVQLLSRSDAGARGRVPSGGECSQLSRDGSPTDQDEHRRPGDEAEGHQGDGIERRIPAEPELRSPITTSASTGPTEPGSVERVADPARAVLDLWQPQPGIERRQQEHDPVRADERRRDLYRAECDERPPP